MVIQDNSGKTNDDTDDFYKDWYIQTTGTVGGSSTSIFAKTTDYTASSKTLVVTNWYSESTHENEVTVTAISNGTKFHLQSPAAYNSITQTKLDEYFSSNSSPINPTK